MCIYIKKDLHSNNKTVLKATLLKEVNSKIKTGKRNSSIKIPLTCGDP